MSRRHSRDLRRERYNQNRESALAPNRNMANNNVNLTQVQYQALLDRITALEGQPAQPAQVVVQPAQQPQVFVSNPYQADINPSTSNGLKMYQTATKTRDTLLNPRIKNKKEFMDAMKSDAVSFGWGSLINNVIVGTKTCKILVDVQELDVIKVRSFE